VQLGGNGINSLLELQRVFRPYTKICGGTSEDETQHVYMFASALTEVLRQFTLVNNSYTTMYNTVQVKVIPAFNSLSQVNIHYYKYNLVWPAATPH